MKRTRTIFLVIFLMLLCVDINIYAAENENMDYDEEIEMFQDFYAHADDYIFQDAEGNDITAYVYEQEENFKNNSYQTTDILMEKVRSVQKRSPMLSRTASKSKTWSNMKVYFKKNKYCVYSVTGTYTLSGNKITNGKAIPKIVLYIRSII